MDKKTSSPQGETVRQDGHHDKSRKPEHRDRPKQTNCLCRLDKKTSSPQGEDTRQAKEPGHKAKSKIDFLTSSQGNKKAHWTAIQAG